MKRVCFPLAGLGLFLFLFAAVSAAAPVDRIVAVVNNEVITLSELDRQMDPYVKRIGEEGADAAQKEAVIGQIREKILSDMIEGLLIDQEAKRLGIVVTDGEVEDMVRDVMQNRGLTMAQLGERIAREGLTMEEYRKGLRSYLYKMKVMAREVKPKVIVTDEEIGEYYRKNLDLYEGKEAVRIRQILIIVPPASPGEKKEALRKEAEGLLLKVRAGAPFPELAMRHSQGPAASSGGDLGFMERGVMLPEVDRVAFSMERGETSGVIETRVGFHIIQVSDKRGAGIKPVEEVRGEIRDKIGGGKMEKKFQEWMDQRREKALIDVRL